MALPYDVSPGDLAQTGWGVILPEDTPAEIERSLEPLLEYRRRQAGDLFRRLRYTPGESARQFLWNRHGVAPGPLDPQQFPYYLLLVGNPQSIPFEFQIGLSMSHAVGRLWFEDVESYLRYADSAVAAERRRPINTPRITFFVVQNDRVTQRLARDLAEPLSSHLASVCPEWEITTLRGSAASKDRLGGALSDNRGGTVLFVSSHGVSFPSGHEHQQDFQGGLVCQDWPGQGAVERRHFFVAEDIQPDAQAQGLIAFLLADFGSGTLAVENFPGEAPTLQASEPFIAQLPLALLRHGALAVVARLGRGSSLVFERPEGSRGSPIKRAFEDVLVELLRGSRIGHALRPITDGATAIAADLAELLDRPGSDKSPDGELAAVWTLYHDLRSFLLMGDPAVRNPGAHRNG